MQNLIISKTKLEASILTKLNKTEQILVTLKQSENIPFGEMTNEQKQALAKCLVKLCYFVGIKEPLSIDNLKMLVYYLANQHSTFTQEELEQAFFMASSGEFGEVEHYQSFSPMYVSKIINAYITKRSEAMVNYYAKVQQFENQKNNEIQEKNYDKVKGFIEVICLQYDCYLRYDEIIANEDKRPLEETRAEIAIQMGQRLGFFQDFKQGGELAIEFFKRIFDPLPKQDANEVKKIISKWVISKTSEPKKH